jgi:D-alanyl-D-alanine carboxypeptidase
MWPVKPSSSFVRFAAWSVLLVPFCAQVSAQDPAQDPAWLGKVDALVAERLAKPDAVGFSVGIAQRGKVLLAKGYGLAEAEFRVPADAATRFRIGSITKQFTAALILRAFAAQKLALGDGIERYVSDFPLQGKTVTLRQLLTHSSGIPNYTDVGEAWERTTPLELSDHDLLAFVAGKPFDFEPGTDWRYSNTGYYLLGMVLEKIHGKPYAQIVRDELAVPLGLLHTRYDSNRELIENRAQGYTVRDGKLGNDDLLGVSQPGAAGGLLSSGEDLVRWSMALADGKVVPPELYALMTTPLVLPNGRDTGYGFGVMRGEVLGKPAILHGGGIHGFNSQLLHVLGDDLHVAVISNCERESSDKLAKAIVRAVLDLPVFEAKDLPVPAAKRALYQGDYAFADIGLTLRIEEKGEKLRGLGQAEGQQPFDLLWQGELDFRASFDPEVRLVFSADGKEVVLHQGGGLFVGRRK